MPRQKLGQHFLHDTSVLDRMLDSAPCEPAQLVVEVGPGRGVLTQALLSRGDRVLAIEWDGELTDRLQVKFAGNENVTIVHADIRTFYLMQYLKMAGNVEPQYRIIANLPYYLTSYFLRQVFQYEVLPQNMTILVQKEVAERIVAPPGSSERSILSVLCQAYSEPKLLFVVPAKAFTPPPKVDSAVLQFKIISRTFFSDIDERQFFRFVKAGFSAKRKTLANALSGGLRLEKGVVEDFFKTTHIDPSQRAQDLTLDQWKKLAQAKGE